MKPEAQLTKIIPVNTEEVDIDVEHTIALHTAARRYCMERALLWRLRYVQLLDGESEEGTTEDGASVETQDGAWEYSEDALRLFPRYNVLDAILVEVERFVPGNFRSLAEARELLGLAGHTAGSPFTGPPQEALALQSMSEERELFAAYVRELSESDLASIKPLPYRRVLGDEESRRLRQQVDKRWGTGEGYWHPLLPTEPPGDVIAFQARFFQEEVPVTALQNILAERGITRLWELRESGVDYEIDRELLEPFYNGDEGYWTAGTMAEEMDWLLYASHENSITIGGEWLLKAVKAIWPDWQQRLYTSWDDE